MLGGRRWRELVADRKKIRGHCSTGQSPQWAVVPMEEEMYYMYTLFQDTTFYLSNRYLINTSNHFRDTFNGRTSRGKGKAVPLQAWSGPEGSRKLRFPDYMTTAQDGGKVVSLMHRPPLPPGNAPGTHFC